MKILMLFTCFIFASNSGKCQQTVNYEITIDSKGRFGLLEVKSNEILYLKCDSIYIPEYVREDSINQLLDYFVIVKKDELILFNSKIGKKIYLVDNVLSFEFKALAHSKTANETAIDLQPIIHFTYKSKSIASGHVLINENSSLPIYGIRTEVFIKYNDDGRLIIVSHGFKDKFIDFDGKVILPIKDGDNFQEFEDGFIVRVHEDYKWKYGVIDKTGNQTIPYVYSDLTYTSNNFLIAKNMENKVGVINIKGDTVVPFIYKGNDRFENEQHRFSNNGIFILHKNSQEGNFVFVDTNNTILVPAGTFNEVLLSWTGFGERFFYVKGNNGLDGVYDTKTKKMVFNCEYKFILDYQLQDLGLVTGVKDGKWGCMNLNTGEILIPFVFDPNNAKFYSLIDGESIFILNKMGRYGLISLEGEELVPFEYDGVRWSRSFWIVKKNGLYGLLSRDNLEEVLPIEFSRISNDLQIEKIVGDILKKGHLSDENELIWD